jgi:hypothetical protein
MPVTVQTLRGLAIILLVVQACLSLTDTFRYLWPQHMHKAALEKYIRLPLQRQLVLENDVKERRLRAYGSFL